MVKGWVDAAITQTTKADEEVQIDPTGEKYSWNEDNQLVKSVVNGQEAFYSYDTSGQRVVKKSVFGETVYINQFMEVKDDDLATKFIYVGESRVISKLSHIHDLNGGEYERINTYYHHQDHLGTSNVITDYQGAIYKEIYLTAWGEEFVNRGDTLKKITADFTGHPFDKETGLHYAKSRYYDSKTSRWISVDPILNDYLDGNPVGGVYNPINMSLYHYANNNPIKYVDPNGQFGIVGMWWVGMSLQERKIYRDQYELNRRNKNGNHPGSHHGDFKTIYTRYFAQSEFNKLEGTTVINSEGVTKTFAFMEEVPDRNRPGETRFVNTLCHATSLINEMSEVYTSITKESLTFDQAEEMYKAALKNGGLSGGVPDPIKFLNSAWDYLETLDPRLKGTWSTSAEVGEEHQVYSTHWWFSTWDLHFLNSGSSGNYSQTNMMHDPYDNKEKRAPGTRAKGNQYSFGITYKYYYIKTEVKGD